jgi:hypothetical protein
MENKTLSLGDRYAELTVLALTVIALLIGWIYKSGVENRSVPFQAKGISAQAPQGWLQAKVTGDEILHTTDMSSSGFGTTYVLRKLPIAKDASPAQVANILVLEYSQTFTAFRVLEQREVTVYGRNAYEVTYVFVDTNPNMNFNHLPSIVRGADYIFINGETAVTASFRADQNNYELDLGRFQRFVQSIKY